MPRYKVIGAHRETGEPAELEIVARTPRQAEDFAQAQDILTRKVEDLDAELSPTTPELIRRTLDPRPRIVRKRPRVVHVSLRCDGDTICAIGCGVVLGFGMLWLLGLLLAGLFWGSIFGAAAAAGS